MDEELKDVFKVILVLVIPLLLSIYLIILLLIYAINPNTCYQRWNGSGLQTRWSLFGGCQVNIEEKWVPERAIFRRP